jgi:hypothetical protein
MGRSRCGKSLPRRSKPANGPQGFRLEDFISLIGPMIERGFLVVDF